MDLFYSKIEMQLEDRKILSVFMKIKNMIREFFNRAPPPGEASLKLMKKLNNIPFYRYEYDGMKTQRNTELVYTSIQQSG